MNDQSSYAKPKRQGRLPSGEPVIYGIFDTQLKRWHMINGLVFNSPYQVVAEAQLVTMVANLGPLAPIVSPRFVVLPLGSELEPTEERDSSVPTI